MTLGELIQALSQAPRYAQIRFHDGKTPYSFHAYKGNPTELEIDAYPVPQARQVIDFLVTLKQQVNNSFSSQTTRERYLMTPDTELWYGEYNQTLNTRIIAVYWNSDDLVTIRATS